jgi:hypothetical protein
MHDRLFAGFERFGNRDKAISLTSYFAQLSAIRSWGHGTRPHGPSAIGRPVLGRQRRKRADGADSELGRPGQAPARR